MIWNIHKPKEVNEYHESEIGLVERIGGQGWDAWVYLPCDWPPGGIRRRNVGGCYKTSRSAKAAVARVYGKLVGF
jgi:hypothetical protein